MKTSLTDTLIQYRNDFHPVVPFNADRDKLIKIDLSVSNQDLAEEIYCNTELFSVWMHKLLTQQNAVYAIGGYDENRKIYSRSKMFDSKQTDEEPRRLHLGMDVWGKCNTPVMAPLTGVVHSFAFNNNFGDYGATIILSHYFNAFSFHTLYGHLSLNSIKNLQEGATIRQGETFAEFGMQFENGNWPSHLHFQIIIDLGDWNGDYPGVCKLSEREKYLANCPDPDLVLQMGRYL
jgi:murein DD-endopeptidase MepM/ murein hydrolase activator NlpD